MSTAILFVEDDPQVRRAIARRLRAAGYEVAAVGTGLEALETRTTVGRTVGIFDIDLPDIHGAEVARRLLEEQRITQAIFFSATQDRGLLAAASALGPVIAKSAGFDALLTAIRGSGPP